MREDRNSLVNFFARYPKKKYDAGEVIISSGGEARYIFFIDKGIVRSFYIDEKGNELTINLFKPLNLFPLSAVLAERGNVYNIQAFTSVEVSFAPVPVVLKHLDENSQLKNRIIRNFAKGLEGYVIRSFFLIKGSASQKVASTFLMLTKRFGKKINRLITINLPLTHQNIADLAGITRETASIQIGLLKKEKIISTQGKRIAILSFSKLSRKASEDDDGILTNLSF